MAEPESEKRPASLLGTLRTAVKKVRFLLNFSATRWILTSIAGRTAAATTAAQRRLSFGSRRPSLRDAEDDRDGSPASASTGAWPSRTSSLGAATVSRTSSAAYSRSASSGTASTSSASSGGGASPAGDEDIDRRAELFIANFYRHIHMERQVSLQLRYCRADSLEEKTPPSLI